MPKKCPSIVGIDVSLTHTAMWFGEGNYTSVKGGKLRGVTRLKTMYEWVLAALVTNKPRVAVIEGYAYMANSRPHDNIADSFALWCAGLDNALIRSKCDTENLDN